MSQSQCELSLGGPGVFSVPIGNVSLDASITARGVLVTIGERRFSSDEDGQRLAFEVNGYANGTSVYSVGGCSGFNSNSQCEAERGGLFLQNTNQGWSTAIGPQANDSFTLSGTDIINLGSAHIYGFPLDVLSATTTTMPMNTLGLGANSSVLNLLTGSMGAKTILSRTWSIFWGFVGAEKEHQMNGSLVFGGYDQAKVKGSNVSQSIALSNADCQTGLVVYVTDISMGFPSGNESSILDRSSGTALPMCIDPRLTGIELPSAQWFMFGGNVSGTYVGQSNSTSRATVWLADQVYAGNISFTIAFGPKITIPTHQLVIPDRGVDLNGKAVFNDSTRAVMLTEQGQTAIPILGSTFLTSAYMMVNLDEHSLTIWEANQTTNEDLHTVNRTSSCQYSPSNQPASGPSGLNGGQIAGIVIGSLLLVTAVEGITWCLLRRRKRRRQGQESPLSSGQEVDAKPELEAEDKSTQELEAHERPRELSESDELRREP